MANLQQEYKSSELNGNFLDAPGHLRFCFSVSYSFDNVC